jgi:hypothetical protein
VNRKPLRILLEEMVADLEKNPVETHAERLSEIARISSHTISILPSDELLDRYNCIMHALAVVRRLETYPHPLLVARTAFLQHLIDRGVLKPCEPQAGAIVSWSSSKGLQHAGRMIARDRAESKWGIGHLCAHGLEELPQRYGDSLAVFSPIHPEFVLDHLQKFVFSK